MRIGSLDDTAAAFDALIARLERVGAALAGTATSMVAGGNELHDRLGRTQHPRILQILQLTTVAARQVEEASALLAVAVRTAREHAAALSLELRNRRVSLVDDLPQSTGVATGGHRRVPVAWTGQSVTAPLGPKSTGPNTMVPTDPGWTTVDAQNAPQHVRQAAQGFEPRISGLTRPTAGVYDGQRLASGGRYGELADDLAYERIPREGGHPYPRAPNVLYEHVEMKVAADMRRRGLVDTEVILDNSMCGTREFDQDHPLTCQRLLPDAMPAGSRMTVWATTNGGKTFHRKTIHGTGNLIRS